jgi:3-hydroxyacyl-[acyl-carrier-protein] dehydratase
VGLGAGVKFVLIDRISELEAGRRIVAHKVLSLAEEYLADHFPTFPVLPGVLMLEAMVQASAWLVRQALDFAPGLIVLREARNVTYKSFLAPGQVLTIESVCKELSPAQSLAVIDEQNRAYWRAWFDRMRVGAPAAAALK